MAIYDGTSIDAPVFANGENLSGNLTSQALSFTATNPEGAITIKFTSDTYLNESGWEAEISCLPANLAANNFEKKDISIFPNPAQSNFTINSSQEINKVIIYDIAGRKVIERNGVVMIPAFSLERTQELLYAIDNLVDKKEIPKVPIYLDSPLAIKSTAVYRHFKNYLEFDRPILDSPDKDFFSFNGLKETLSVDESKSINEHHGPKIIIAGSGMMSGGRIMHHLKRYLPEENSGLLIIGYQAEGTTGRKIQDGAEMVKIDDDEIPVRAEIQTMDSFSAHGDRAKIRRWLQPQDASAKKIFLVHGDEEVKPGFGDYLKEELDSEVIIPEFQQRFEL